jgi:hypothetical protein
MNDDEIKDVLGKIQPEGFDWVNCTETEMVKFRAIAAEAQSKAIPDEEMVGMINRYLTFRFIGKPEEHPEDECLSEAEDILSQLNIPKRIREAKKERQEKVEDILRSYLIMPLETIKQTEPRYQSLKEG